MKTVLLSIISILSVSLISLNTADIGNRKQTTRSNTVSLSELIESVDTNYTRTTQMFFTSVAYDTISQKNRFPFTQSRTTLWISHGLYMHNSTTDVNSGYYSKSSEGYSKMYHYRLEGGYVNYDSSTASLSENAYSAKGDMNDFFINLHYMHQKGGA